MPAEERSRRFELLHELSLALSAEHDKPKLLETILVESQKLCHADGGTLYLREGDRLEFAILRTTSLGVHLGGSTNTPVNLPAVPLLDSETGAPNHKHVASHAAHTLSSIHIEDAYEAEGFDLSGTRAFDEQSGYRSRSFFCVPLTNAKREVIGVLQLINACDPETGEVTAFRAPDRHLVEALASHAGIALDNENLLQAQRDLLESFIRMIAGAIDAESPYTGAHCERVPVLTEMLVRSLCETDSGPYAEFRLSEEEWYELHIAAWLHDCGKVTTPTHVMDKATKLECVWDRIAAIRTRFEILRRDAEIERLTKTLAQPEREDELRAEMDRAIARLDSELELLESANVGGEFLSEEAKQRIAAIGRRRYVERGQTRALLSDDEVANLCISRGTLTDDERLVINGHMVQTIKMLEALPFPRSLARVPEYAGGHHERMDGNGYPKGIYAGDMSVPARAMAIADVFEALTATDRPYKPGKKLSEAMRIMGFMKRDNHLDPELLDHFVRSGVYREYARRYLDESLIDEVDEAALLAIEPKPFELPPEPERRARRASFLPQYRDR